MARIKLTKSAVDAAQPQAQAVELRDTLVPGFLCKITPSGRKVFMLQYRTNAGERRKPALGQYGELTVEQARSLAQEWLAQVRRGGDPGAAKAEARKAPTVEELCKKFMEDHSKKRNKPSTRVGYQGVIDRCIIPLLGRKKVHDVKRPDIAGLMEKLSYKQTEANKAFSILRKMFNLSEVWGYRPDGTNPCRHVPMFPAGKSTHLISDEDMGKLFRQLDKIEADELESYVIPLAIRLQFEFAARRSEIVALEWEWIDLENRRVVWPDSKTGGMSKPISEEAYRLLSTARRQEGNPYGRRGADRAHGWHAEELTMSQDDISDHAVPQAGKVAPEAMALRAQPRPVTRLNRRTLAILTGGLSVAVLGATIWSLQPHRRGVNEQTELYNVDRVSKSEGLDGLPSDYSKLPAKVPELGPPLPGDLGPAIVHSQQPVTPSYAPPGHDPEDARRKEADAAAASTVFFRSGNPGKAGAPAAAQVAAAGPTSALAGFDPLAAGPASTAAQPSDPTALQNRQDQKEAFLKSGSTETRNSGNLQMPASPYQVMAGTVIAGALVTGIKSDLPGDVIATVTEPVYDTATGKFLLIPQGSRILGKYNSQVSYGQSRVQVVWNRIILPDTSSLKLDNLAGADPAGYAGLEDGVDWHWDRVFAGAALTTLLGVGAELAAPENRQDGNRIVIAGRDSAQDSINQVGQEMTRRNMNIQPTLTERPGLPVRIIVNRDLVLRPYQPLFFNRGAMR